MGTLPICPLSENERAPICRPNQRTAKFQTNSRFVSNVIKDAFALWLNQHRTQGELIASFVIERAQSRLRQAKQVSRKRIHQGPALPGKLADCLQQDLSQAELFLVEGESQEDLQNKLATKISRLFYRYAARF